MFDTNRIIVLAGVAAALSAAPASAQVSVPTDADLPAAVAAIAQNGAHDAGTDAVGTSTVHTRDSDREIAVGETKTGTLSSSDPQLDDGEHYHSYTFQGRANEHIVVSLTSTSFDTYLAIFTTDGDWEDQDDDSGGSSNAELNVTLPKSGRYVIVVTSYAGDETGDYTLAVRTSERGSAGAEDWKRYGTTSDDEAELYYLQSSVRRYAEDVYEVWTRWVYAGMQEASPGGDPYDSEKRLVRVDCRAERLGIVSFVEYSGQAVVNSHTVKNVDLNPAVPESVGESLLRQVCTSR